MLKRQILACILIMLGTLYVAPSTAATLSFSPSSTTVGLGANFNVDVVISGLPLDDFTGAQALVGGFDFTVGYDSSILASTGVQFSSTLGIPDIETVTLSDNLFPGEVFAFNVSVLPDFLLAPLQTTPSFTLATLSFQALDYGTSALDFLGITISDDLALPIATQGISGEVSVIPLPGAVWLMLSGLLGIGALARRRKGA